MEGNDSFGFGSPEVERYTNVKRLRLHQWIDLGHFEPSIQRAYGSGTQNIFSLNDLYKIVLFRKLLQGGLSRSEAGIYSNVEFSTVKLLREQGAQYVHYGVFRKCRINSSESDLHGRLIWHQNINLFEKELIAGISIVTLINLYEIVDEVHSRMGL